MTALQSSNYSRFITGGADFLPVVSRKVIPAPVILRAVEPGPIQTRPARVIRCGWLAGHGTGGQWGLCKPARSDQIERATAMQRMQFTNLEVPHFLIIDGKIVDASYGNDMLVDLLINGDTDGGWCIDAIHIHARKIGDGMLRLGDATFELPTSHELYKPLHDWIVARCSDCITDKWETYVAESSQLRADAWREARFQ